jgi:hypothetical protein
MSGAAFPPFVFLRGLLVLSPLLECIMHLFASHKTELQSDSFAVVETAMTLHAELMLLCARIGYSPPVF